MKHRLERILCNVQKPSRYTGGEYNQIIKDKNEVDTRIAFCFPDTYEIGMSNLGLHIMYGVLNGLDKVWCERVFAPWTDMEEQMRTGGIPLYGLESFDNIRDFDIIAFSIGYELSYTNVLNMLDLAGVPLRSGDRGEDAPLIIAGGTCCYNPEPLSEFIDLFVIGEGEEAGAELIELYQNAKNKETFLKSAALLPGVYIPSLYDVSYNDNGTIKAITTQNNAPFPVVKRIVKDLDQAFYPVNMIVPSTGIVHDRAMLELFRGCIRGCRFCQAGFTGRPVRSRGVETLTKQGIDSLQNSGYDELGLLSLSTSDYKELIELCDRLAEWCEPRKVSLSLPSLRTDNFNVELMERVQKVRKSGLTLAPEAGSQRLRDVINKNVTEADLLESCRIAFEGGWNSVKLYFMLGLPTETDEDVLAIADITYAVLNTWKKSTGSKNKGVRITVSTSCFVPKPHTPFQWEAQISGDEYIRRVELLRKSLRSNKIRYNWHSPEQALIESVLTRGDRRLGNVIESAWKLGAGFDSWSEHFSLDKWISAFEQNNLEPGFYANRKRDTNELLPWSVVSAGVSNKHLINERNSAFENAITPDCRKSCSGCGASAFLDGGRCDA